jgi:hypothetical protein
MFSNSLFCIHSLLELTKKILFFSKNRIFLNNNLTGMTLNVIKLIDEEPSKINLRKHTRINCFCCVTKGCIALSASLPRITRSYWNMAWYRDRYTIHNVCTGIKWLNLQKFKLRLRSLITRLFTSRFRHRFLSKVKPKYLMLDTNLL